MAKRHASDPNQVPCVRVVVGGQGHRKAKAGAKDAKGCLLSTSLHGEGVKKIALRKDLQATSKSVLAAEGAYCGTYKGKPRKCSPAPCLGTGKRKNCPVQLAFDRGQPFLRFCRAPKKVGFRVNVNSPAEAMKIADEACGYWEKHRSFEGFFTEETPLKG